MEIKFLLVVCLAWQPLFYTVCNALVAYDCKQGGVNMTSVSLVELPDCEQDKQNITTEFRQVAVTQVVQFSEVEYIRCHVEEYNVVWRCGKTIDTGYEGGLYSGIPKITRQECERLVKENIYTVIRESEKVDIIVDNTGYHSYSYTSRGSISKDGSCTPGVPFSRNGLTYDRPVRNTLVTIRFSSGKARLAHDEDLINFPMGFGCKYSEGHCTHSDSGHLFWTKVAPECGDKDDRSLIFSGKGTVVTDFQHQPPIQYLQVSYGGYDFQIQLLEKTDFVCGYKSHFTEHPRLFVTILGQDGPRFPLTKKVSPIDVNLLNYVNSKIVYSMRHTKQEVNRLFKMFEMDRCRTQNRITTTMLSLASQDPVEFAYLYFQRPGYTAVTRGEVVHIAKCSEVAVEVDTSVEGCFNELPVVYNNKTMFMAPKTRILLEVGKIVSCLPDLAPRYLVNGIWVTRTKHGLLKTETPTVMRPESIQYSFSELEGLSSGGLYTSETIQKYQEILTSPLIENVITSRVASAVSGQANMPHGYQFTSGFSESDYLSIREQVSTWWEKTISKFSYFGEIVSGLIGIVVVIKVVTYILSCVLNFRVMYESFGFLTAVVTFWWETLCNVMLHRKRQGRGDVENPELYIYTNI